MLAAGTSHDEKWRQGWQSVTNWRIRLRLARHADPLPVGICGLIAGFCFGTIFGMVGLRVIEQWW